MLRHSFLVLAFLAASFGGVPLASAQGLIWNAPDEGAEMQFEGDYLQEDERPQEVEKRIKMQWRSRLWIKALKKTNAEYQGQTVPCQWFEIKVETGSETGDGDLVLGPGGKRIYKILVPLERGMKPILNPPSTSGNVVDAEGIPIAYLPIVKGYRRLDEQAAEPIASGVLNTYPMLSLMAQYRTLDVVSEQEDPQVMGVTSATHFHGEAVMESPTSRSTNKAEIWANNTLPFGLARWKVDIVRESKDAQAARDQFMPASTIRIDMKLVKQSNNAMSDLAEE